MASEDRKTIGVSVDSQATLDRLMSTNVFHEQVDAARLALSVGLLTTSDCPPQEERTTKWNVGTFDPTGEVRDLVACFRPEIATPYRESEVLVEIGLKVLKSHLSTHGQLDLEVLLGLDDESTRVS